MHKLIFEINNININFNNCTDDDDDDNNNFIEKNLIFNQFYEN